MTYYLQEDDFLWPCKAPKFVDGLESGGKHIPRIGIVVGYTLDPSPQEVKRGLEDPFIFSWDGMGGLYIKVLGVK